MLSVGNFLMSMLLGGWLFVGGMWMFCRGIPELKIRRFGVLYLLVAISGGLLTHNAWTLKPVHVEIKVMQLLDHRDAA